MTGEPTLVVAARFNGPPDSGNGGYVSGLLASRLPEASSVRVRLHRPPPLGTELEVRFDHDEVAIFDGTELVAAAVAEPLDADPVPPVDFAEAERASLTYRGFDSHPFPSCFVCGPTRKDGLGIFPGRLADGRTAAPFVAPSDSSIPLTWASLDCPGGWTAPLEDRPYVLGQLTAEIHALPEPDQQCVVVGQLDREEGRKAYVRTSLYGPEGLLAAGRAIWIARR